MKNTKRQKIKAPRAPRPPQCPLCQTVVAKRGDLCPEHHEMLTLGKHLREHGAEIRVRREPIMDPDGMTVAVAVFDPLLKLNVPNLTQPQAISVRGTWYVRVDANHPLNRYYDERWDKIGEE